MDARSELHRIVHGIDRAETESADGWWETSTGAEFGAERLRRLVLLVAGLDAEVVRLREGIAAHRDVRENSDPDDPDAHLADYRLWWLLDGPRQEGGTDG